MWIQHIAVLLIGLLVYSASVEGKKNKPDAFYNIYCPADDDPNDPTHLPLQGDCSKFLKCSYGKAYTLQCPRNLQWSVQHDACESAEVANCDPNATTPAPVIGGGGCTFKYKPHPTDCHKFILCASLMETELECVGGYYWDQSKEQCVASSDHCN